MFDSKLQHNCILLLLQTHERKIVALLSWFEQLLENE